MSHGIDADESVEAYCGCLKEAGIEWVGRYLPTSKREPLTKAEALHASRMDLFLVSLWESGYPTQAGYFTTVQARRDGASANRCAVAVGQSKDTPIYFTVDYDAAQEDLTAITAYFLIVKEQLRTDFGGEGAAYTLGVYGNGRVCAHLKAKGIVEKTWLAGSTGWAGYEAWKPHCDILQTEEGVDVCGLNVDRDIAMPSGGGGWQIKA